MKDRYVVCYVSGRSDGFEGTYDLPMLVAKIESGSPLRETVLELARKTLLPEMDAATKVAWLTDNVEAIREMGGDTEKAWRLFCQGRVDSLAAQLDEEAMEALVNQLEDEEEDEDDEDEGDEGDEEDEDDEDDEDDDEEDD